MKKIIITIFLIITLLFAALLGVYNISHDRDSPINVNTCSYEALVSLPEIGEVLADRIIQGRPYKDKYELIRVYGIGEKRFNKIKNMVVVY